MKITALTVGAIQTNCYLVSDQNGDAVIIDPGAEPEKIAACLAEEGLNPLAILLTHGHFDHIGGVSALKERFGIPFYLHGADTEMQADAKKNGSAAFGMPVPDLSGARTVADGETVKAGNMTFTLLHTPGHTKGSCCYQAGDALFTGDTLFCGGVGRTDLYGGDWREILQSLGKLAALPGKFHIYPGHGPFSSLDAERAENPYMGMNKHDDLF
ncbi:MAG: MBL fold metallo-hydrolase [Candidatus Merdivicinus sp.]|jgi:hydroxyacylglutathione hydrolase